jgi:hypothetical protein
VRVPAGVDVVNVSASLLRKLGELARAHPLATFTVNSGHRDSKLQAQLYRKYVNSGYDPRFIAAPPGRSNHEANPARALDVSVDGRPIDSLGAGELARFGLHTPVAGDHPHLTELGVWG